ncbi:hypothetical protein BFJ69_g9893 [Fusarium oxysporum]|uniref:Uncharacterized protein n=1 Tax=Fusarium oxysporum TaxID=5507 RepID=A0A420MXH6_FUSOX|nr:hypothetical protein BFJ69_g9893 [Fusarium oxysporum]
MTAAFTAGLHLEIRSSKATSVPCPAEEAGWVPVV